MSDDPKVIIPERGEVVLAEPAAPVFPWGGQATILTGKHGRFVNALEGEGFDWHATGVTYHPRFLPIFPKQHWTFILNPATPLTWEDFRPKYKGFWRPTKKRKTDGGTVPNLLRAWFPESQYPASYSDHDDAWADHAPDGGLGLYFSETYDGPYVFRELSRRESNGFLPCWIDAEGGGRFRQGVVRTGVAIGAVGSSIKDLVTH